MRVVPKPWGREEIFAENERYAGKILHLSRRTQPVAAVP